MFQNTAGTSGARGPGGRMPGPAPQPGKGGSAFAAQASGAAPHWKQCPPRSASHKSFGQGSSQDLFSMQPGMPGAQTDAVSPAGAQAGPAGIGGQTYRSPTVEDDDEGYESGGETGEAASGGEAVSIPADDPFAPVGGSGRGGQGGSGGSDEHHQSGHDAVHDSFGAASGRSRSNPAPEAGKRKRVESDEDEGYGSGSESTYDFDGHGDAKRRAVEGVGLAALGSHIARSGTNDDDDDDTAKVDPGKAMRAKPGHLGRHAGHVKGLSKAWEKDPNNLNEAQQNDEPQATQEDFDKYSQSAFENSARLGDLAAMAADAEMDGAAEPLTAGGEDGPHLNPAHPLFGTFLDGIKKMDDEVQAIGDDEDVGEAVVSYLMDDPVLSFVCDDRAKRQAAKGNRADGLFRAGSTFDNLMLPEFHIDSVARMKDGTFHVPDTVNIGGDKEFYHMSDYNHRRHIERGKTHKLQGREVYQVQRLSPIIHILGDVYQYYKDVADASLKGYEGYIDKMPLDPGTGKPISHYYLTPEGQFFKGFIAAFLDFDCALLGNFWRHTVYRGQSFKASWNQVISQILWQFGEDTAAGSSGGADRKNKSEARIFNRSLKSKSVRQKDGLVPVTRDFDGGKGFDIRKHEDRFEEFCDHVQDKYIKPRLEQMIHEDDIRRKTDKELYDRKHEETRDYVSHDDGIRARETMAKLEQANAERDPEKKKQLLKEAYFTLEPNSFEDQASGGDPAHLGGGAPDGVYAAVPRNVVLDIDPDDNDF